MLGSPLRGARRVGCLVVAASCAIGAPISAASAETQTYTMPSESMMPAFKVGQVVVVDLDAYDSAAPAIGDAIVFHPPRGSQTGNCGVPLQRGKPCRVPTPKLSSQLFLKRVVAAPGDRFSVRGGRPVVNGATVLADLIQPCRFGACNLERSIAIPPDHYFVMGDNSAVSSDSRFWGPVPTRAIVGKVIP